MAAGVLFDETLLLRCLVDDSFFPSLGLEGGWRGRDTDSWVTVELEPLELLVVLVMAEKKEVTEDE